MWRAGNRIRYYPLNFPIWITGSAKPCMALKLEGQLLNFNLERESFAGLRFRFKVLRD